MSGRLKRRAVQQVIPYAYALAGVAVISLAIGLVRSWFAVPNLSMVYLLLVLWLGARHGILPAAAAGVGAFLAYDFFFVPPVGTLFVSAPHELLGLVLLLAAALVTGQLAASLRNASAESAAVAGESRALYELATTAIRLPEVSTAIGLVCERARQLTGVETFSLVAIQEGSAMLAGGDTLTEVELRRSQWSFDNRTAVGAALDPAGLRFVRVAGAGEAATILPLSSGVAFMKVDQHRLDASQRRLLAALVSLGSLLLDRRAVSIQAQRVSNLEASDSLKAAVLSSLSHELKSPLAALRAGLTSLLGPAAGLDAEHRELVGGLDREAARLDRLVGELLTMSRLESGQALVLEQRSFPELCGAVLERLAGQLTDRRLMVDVPGALPLVLMDELQLDRVLTNLLENAVEFTPVGGRIDLVAREEPGRLLVWIENEGPMIPAGDLARIFDKFWTGRTTGTGLGLAICKRIVESHGGQIEVRNRRSGPRFQFTLPLSAVQAPA